MQLYMERELSVFVNVRTRSLRHKDDVGLVCKGPEQYDL